MPRSAVAASQFAILAALAVGAGESLAETDELLPLPEAGNILVLPQHDRPEHPLHTDNQPTTSIWREPGEPHRVRVDYSDGTVAEASLIALARARGYLAGETRDDADRISVTGFNTFKFLRTDMTLGHIRQRTPYPKKYVSSYALRAYEASGEPIVDFACGGGHFTLDLLDKGVNMFGFDIILRRPAADPNGRLSNWFVQTQGEWTGFRDGTFLGLFANYSPIWVTAKEHGPYETAVYLNEIDRILQPGGFAVLGPVGPNFAIALEQTNLDLYEGSRVGHSRGGDWPGQFDFAVVEKRAAIGNSFLRDVFGEPKRVQPLARRNGRSWNHANRSGDGAKPRLRRQPVPR